MSEPEARWYCVDSIGLATLCHDEADARRQAEERSRAWPEGMPCRAVQLGDVAALAAERDSLLRDWVAEQGERTAAVDRAERAELERDRLRAELAAAPVTCQTYGPGVAVPCAECNQTLVDSQELAELRERAAERERFPNLLPVIQWLERGCDPKEAAKELRIYQQMLAHNA